MNVNRKSQRAFAAVTLMTTASVAFVLIVYAALLGTMPGGEVFIGGSSSVTGTVYYATDNAAGPWTTTLNLASASESWFARLNTNTGYAGPVTVTWQLQIKAGTSTWNPAGSTLTTNVDLDGTAQTVYTQGFSYVSNHDWVTEVGGQNATYRVYVTVSTNP